MLLSKLKIQPTGMIIKFHKSLIFCLLGMVTAFYSCSSTSTPADTSTPPPEGGEVSDTTFYINNQQDFDKYKNKEFPAGATILFAQGQIFNGQFAPTGSGTPENPIIVTAYDPESGAIYTDNIDEKPIINGQGKVNSAFYLRNEQFWEISNLEITNTDGSDEDQGDLRGIHVVAEDIGVAEHIIIKNCYVHNVNGKVEGKGRGGIHIHVYGEDKPTRFDHYTERWWL